MKYQSLITRNRLFLLLFLFFFLRVIYSYFFGWQEIPSGSDANSYNGYALAILNKADWLTNPDFYGHYRAPVYPLCVAAIYKVFGIKNFFAVYCVQAILSTLTVYYIFRLSSAVFDGPRSFLALFWAGFYFFYFWYVGMLLRETLVFFLIIFCFYHLWVFLVQKEQRSFLRSIDLWKFAIAFVLLLHTDPRFLFYIPFMSILFVSWKGLGIGVKQFSWFCLILVLLLAPWTVRNYVAYDGFVLINTRTLGKSISSVTRTLSNRDRPFPKVRKDYPTEEERSLIKKGGNPRNRSAAELEIIKKDVYPPSSRIERTFYRLKEMWLPFRFWSDYDWVYKMTFRDPWSLRHNLISILFYGTLIPFALYCLFVLVKQRIMTALFLALPIFAHALLHFILGAGRARYRMHIDAFIIILGCYGITMVYEMFRNRRKSVRVQAI